MTFAFIVWAIGTLPALGSGMVFVGLLASALVVFIKGVALTEGANLPLMRYLFITIPMLCVGAIIPDKETAYAMAAAYGVQTVVQDERVQKVAGQGIEVLEAYLAKTKKEIEGTK